MKGNRKNYWKKILPVLKIWPTPFDLAAKMTQNPQKYDVTSFGLMTSSHHEIFRKVFSYQYLVCVKRAK